MSDYVYVRPRPRKPARNPLDRSECPTCGQDVPCTWPRGGDGSARRVRRHLTRGERCSGTGRIVTAWYNPADPEVKP